MKTLLRMWALVFTANTYGQTKTDQITWRDEQLRNQNLKEGEYKDTFLKYEFDSLWTGSDYGLGFIGPHYQRLRLKIISARKDAHLADSYLITGKSMVKNNAYDFTGRIKIANIRICKTIGGCEDDTSDTKGIRQEGIIIGEYSFAEDKSQKHSGTFEGVFCSSWFIDKNGELRYDDLSAGCNDSYCNNQFVGTWKGYGAKSVKVCNWGDSRIPQSGDLDNGAGEFCPNREYLQYGWQTYMDAWEKQDYDVKARQEEQRKWWK